MSVCSSLLIEHFRFFHAIISSRGSSLCFELLFQRVKIRKSSQVAIKLRVNTRIQDEQMNRVICVWHVFAWRECSNLEKSSLRLS